MPATYEPIATTTLGSTSSTITFSSIPGTYTDLKVVLVGTLSDTISLLMRFNNDSTSLYSRTRLSGQGTNASTTRSTSATSFLIGPMYSTQPGFFETDIFNYAGSTNKTMLYTLNMDRNTDGGEVIKGVGLYGSTSAITQVNLITATGTFSVGTTATLYGILKA